MKTLLAVDGPGKFLGQLLLYLAIASNIFATILTGFSVPDVARVSIIGLNVALRAISVILNLLARNSRPMSRRERTILRVFLGALVVLLAIDFYSLKDLGKRLRDLDRVSTAAFNIVGRRDLSA